MNAQITLQIYIRRAYFAITKLPKSNSSPKISCFNGKYRTAQLCYKNSVPVSFCLPPTGSTLCLSGCHLYVEAMAQWSDIDHRGWRDPVGVHVCACVCMCIHVCAGVCTSRCTCVCKHACEYIHVCACKRTCASIMCVHQMQTIPLKVHQASCDYMCVHVCVCVCRCVHVCACVCMCVQVCTCVCRCVHVCTCECM